MEGCAEAGFAEVEVEVECWTEAAGFAEPDEPSARVRLSADISNTASSIIFAFTSPCFFASFFILFFDFTMVLLSFPAIISLFFLGALTELEVGSDSRGASQGLECFIAGSGTLGRCNSKGDSGGERRSVDLRVTLDVSEANEVMGRVVLEFLLA